MFTLTPEVPVPSAVLAAVREAVETALRLTHQPSDADLTILITDDSAIRRLNRDFMGKDAPTDVLSFPAGERDPESGKLYLGDIVISYPRAQEQASQGGHAVAHEMQLLSVHGLLHLLGYDHLTPGDKRRMWEQQAAILKEIGCPLTPP